MSRLTTRATLNNGSSERRRSDFREPQRNMRNTAAWPSFKRVFTGDKRCHRAFLCCGDRIATIHDHRAASPILAGSPLIGRAVQKFFDVRHLKSVFTTKNGILII